MQIPDEALKHFTNRILAISPDVENFIGAGAAGDSGGHNASGQMVYELRKAAINFARAYRDPQTAPAELQRLAAQVEGGLLAVATILRFEPEFSDELVSQLHGFVRARAGQPG